MPEYQNIRKTSLPDGPQIRPLLHQLRWGGRALEFLDSCALKYGSLFTLQIAGAQPIVVVSHPQAVKEIFTAPPEWFDSGTANRCFRPLLGNYSLLVLDGSSHKRQRRLLMPPFHHDCMQQYGHLICDSTQQQFNQWPVNKPFVIRSAIQAITLDIILQIVFGSNQEHQPDQLNRHLNLLINAFLSPFPWQRASFSRKKQEIDAFISAEICQRRTHVDPTRTDILTLLLTAEDEAGHSMTDEAIRDELITLIMAGYETTTTATLWALYWVTKLPEVRETLLSELSGLGSNPSPTEIAQLPYLSAVCSETLRIYSITGFAFDRITKVPLKVMGYTFEPGTKLSCCTYLTHRRADIYPEPKQFKPERFLERQFAPYEYYPFGGGNRRCIGIAFAQFELKLVLATILAQIQLSLVNNRPVRPVLRGITVTTPLGLRMVRH